MGIKIIGKNKKAFYDFQVLEKYEAGISLQGTEVKSLRAGKLKLTDTFCAITDDYQLEIHNLHISPYDFGNLSNHEPKRIRPLLMHFNEIKRLQSKIKEKGLTLIPISLYFKNSWVKVEIALCKGKKLHDKRASIKDKEMAREINRSLKNDF